jgi:hypothetical protein
LVLVKINTSLPAYRFGRTYEDQVRFRIQSGRDVICHGF